MSWRLSCRSGWATEREGLRLANPGAIVLLGLLGEAGSPVTLVSLPAHGPPCVPGSLIRIRHIRGMRSCWQRAARPAQPSDGSDRGCPLSTVVDPPIWHASGTANCTRWSAGHWSGPECRGPRHSSTSRRAYCSLCSTGGRRGGERKPDLHSTRAGSGRDGSGSGLGDGSDCGCG
jgi:hypothetical protein